MTAARKRRRDAALTSPLPRSLCRFAAVLINLLEGGEGRGAAAQAGHDEAPAALDARLRSEANAAMQAARGEWAVQAAAAAKEAAEEEATALEEAQMAATQAVAETRAAMAEQHSKAMDQVVDEMSRRHEEAMQQLRAVRKLGAL